MAVTLLCTTARFQAAAADFRKKAERSRLIAGEEINAVRRAGMMMAVVALTSVSTIKIVLAISLGRGNFGLLIFLTILGCVISFVLTKGRLTELGRKTLADAMHLYSGMPGRVAQEASRVSPQEVAMTAGLFGLGVLGTSTIEGASLFRGMAPQSTASETSGGCGSTSSCSSSSSSCSSGGSSCGGCSSS